MAVRVKICGITNLEDALQAAACGADALGFILWPQSPRAITPEAAKAVIAQLPPFVTPVGVFVNESAQKIEEYRDACGLRAVQLHGDEDPAILKSLRAPVIKAFRTVPPPEELARWTVDGFLADGAVARHYGGTGTPADQAVIDALSASGRLILAGGLTAETVAERVTVVRPYAVDVASGVEAAPGRKDHDKVARFIAACRNLP